LLKGSEFARARFDTIRLRLLKIGARMEVKKNAGPISSTEKLSTQTNFLSSVCSASGLQQFLTLDGGGPPRPENKRSARIGVSKSNPVGLTPMFFVPLPTNSALASHTDPQKSAVHHS